MKLPAFRVSTLMMAIALVAIPFGAWNFIVIRQKVGYCRGWANTYSRKADFYRAEAAKPNLSPRDADGYRWQARKEDLTAKKYELIADEPWRPYPTAPFYSSEEWASLGPMP